MTQTSSVNTAVIPAAGLGTRFLPLTKSQPKEMLPLVDKPAIQYVVEEAVLAGISDILIITGPGKRAIEDHFSHNSELDDALRAKGKFAELEILEEIESLANIHYVRQAHAHGLGHAVATAHEHVGDQPFAVMLGDDIMVDDSRLLSDMKEDFESTHSSVMGIMEVTPEEISSYGCASFETVAGDPSRIKITGVVEKPSPELAPSNFAIIGRYIFDPHIFSCIDRITAGVGGEIQLTDAISLLLEEQDIYGRVLSGGRYDVGQKTDWLLANVALALQREDLEADVRKGLSDILDAR